MKKIILFSFLLLGGVATATAAPPISSLASPSTPLAATCPLPSQISKNPAQGNWVAQTSSGSWKSYDMSFATNLTSFLGAQWVGAAVGQITCIYGSNQQYVLNGQLNVLQTEPVLLVFHTLTRTPSGGGWKHVQHGVYNCQASDVSQCPFYVNIQQQTGNIFDEAESLKKNNASPISPLGQ